jgi:hypothetical protein
MYFQGDDGAIAFYETIQGLLLQNRQMEENLRLQHFNKITALKRQHLALESSLRTKHIVSAKEKCMNLNFYIFNEIFIVEILIYFFNLKF